MYVLSVYFVCVCGGGIKDLDLWYSVFFHSLCSTTGLKKENAYFLFP